MFVQHPVPEEQWDSAQQWQTNSGMLQTKWRLTYVIVSVACMRNRMIVQAG